MTWSAMLPRRQPNTGEGDEYPLGGLLDQDLLAWEIEQMTRLGLEATVAIELAASRVSWHDIDRLIRAGCDPATAARIAR